MSNKNEIAVSSASDMPVMIPESMDKDDIFNAIQDTKPIAEICGKPFKFLGVIPEKVMVPKNRPESGDITDYDGELVERNRFIILTSIGNFHSFSISFNSNLVKLINVFGVDYTKKTFTAEQKTSGSGSGMRVYYKIMVVKK